MLVIEDERHVRSLLAQLFDLWGCQADTVATGAEGLSLFDRGQYDLVMTDLLMPGLTGLEVVEAVRRVDPDVGILMLTGSTAPLHHHGRRLGFAVLRKPLDLEGLERAVRQSLAVAR